MSYSKLFFLATVFGLVGCATAKLSGTEANALRKIASVGAASEKKSFALNCTGYEPSWSLEIADKEITLQASGFMGRESEYQGVPTLHYHDASLLTTAGFSEGSILVYKGSGYTPIRMRRPERYPFPDSSRLPATFVITRPAGGCSDGKHDQMFDYSVVVIGPDKILAGCCNPAS